MKIFTKIAPLFTLTAELHPFLIPQGYTKTVEFPMIARFPPPPLSVLLAQLLKGSKLLCVLRCNFCKNLSLFYTLSFSRYLFLFAADFVTL